MEANVMEVNKLKREVEDVICELEKAMVVLNHWTNEYSFHDKPDPRAAIRVGEGQKEDKHGEQSALWYYDYTTITQFINIVGDYVYDSIEQLKELAFNQRRKDGMQLIDEMDIGNNNEFTATREVL